MLRDLFLPTLGGKDLEAFEDGENDGDSKVPLPRNLSGLGIRMVEATFGREHYPSFKSFLAGGGIPALLEASGLRLTVTHRSSFWGGCREVVVLSHAATAQTPSTVLSEPPTPA